MIYLCSLNYKVIDFVIVLSYLVVVFQSYCYYECFCLVDFGLFSCIDRMIYLVLCIFVVYFDCLAKVTLFFK